MPEGLLGGVMGQLESAVARRVRRHELLASNLAHASTPGYRARDLEFAVELEKGIARANGAPEMRRTDPRHLTGPSGPDAIVERDDPIGRDGNNVALDQELGRLQSNATHVEATLQMLRHEFQQIEKVLSANS